ncbi:MAG: hypothetical protein WKG06_36555 [Segetibacter sp.]
MNTIEKRRKLVEYIKNSDDKIIDTLFSIIWSKKILHEDFLRDYNREIDEAMERIDKGFFITQEDVENEAEKW